MLHAVLLCALLGPARAGRAPSRPASQTLTVALTRGFSSATAVDVRCGPDARVFLDDRPISTGDASGVWRVSLGDGGLAIRMPDGTRTRSGRRCEFAPGNADDPLGLSRAGSARPVRYRGAIEIRATAGSRLLVLNRVSLEDYLRGVVPAEMPAGAPSAALQAQAICARTYALKLLQSGKYRARGYDLNDTTMCQAYGGASAETPATDAAVRETAGQALTRNGALIWADYCDDCGGYTAPGDTPDDFPPAVLDVAEDGSDLCSDAPHHVWTLTLTPDEIARRLGAAAKGIGRVTSIEIVERDETGRVRTANIVGEEGETTAKGTALRAALGYEELRSTRFGVVRNDDGSFTFTGKGNGHGRGLCQWGAMALAKPPKALSCAQILDHYFPGATIGEAPTEEARGDADRETRNRPSP